MAVPYPSSPAVGDSFTYEGVVYTWTGVAWISTFVRTPGTVGSVAVVAPITNSGTPTAPVVGLDQGALLIGQSQVTNLVSDLAGKASTADLTAGLALKANLAGGNALTGSQSITIPGSAGTNALSLISSTNGASNLVNLRFQSSNGNLFDMGKNEVSNQGGSFYLYSGTALPIEFYNGGTKRFIVESTGNVNIGPTTGNGFARLTVFTDTATRVGMAVRGAASQTADLQQWQNSAGTVGAKVDSNGVISTSAYLGISGTITNPNVFGVLYGTGSPGTYAEGSLSTNAGFSTPVMLPNEEGYYPYWGFKTPNVVETSADGTTWTVVDPTAYRSLFAFQNGSSINVTTRFLRITHYQPLFTFLALVSARFVGGTNNKPITMKTELLNSDFTTVNSTFGPTTGVVGFDGAALMQKFNSYNGSTRATRVTFDMALWSAGDTYQIGSVMAYMSKPGTGFGFQNKFPMSWDLNKTTTFQPTQPGAKGLIVKAATTLTSTITGAVANGTTITYTTSTQHGFLAGYVVSITGIVSTGNPSATAGSGFNLTNATIASVTSQTTFTVTNGLTDTYTSGGSLTVSQGSNLQEWQNSAGTVVARVEPAGNLIISGIGVTSGDHRVGTASYFSAALNVLARATTEKGLVVRGQASQTASMLELQNSAGSITANFTAPVNNVNRLNLGGTDLSATLGITVHASGGVGQVIRGAASQTADLLQLQNSGGTVQSYFDSFGNAHIAQAASGSSFGLYVGTNANPAVGGIMVRGAASQTGNLLEFRDSFNNIHSGIAASGFAWFGGSSTAGGQLGITAEAATNRGLVIKGAASQTANLTEWQNSSASIIARVHENGDITARVLRSTLAARIQTNDPTVAPMVLTGATSQTADFLQLQNSVGTVLASFSTSGSLSLDGTNAAIILGGSAGTSGQVLTSNGAGSRPSWTTVSGGGSFTGGTLTGNLTLAVGTTSLSPLTFQSGTNLTTVTAGANEYDGTVFYKTSNTNPGRALATQNYYYVASTDWNPDFSTSSSAKSLLGAATRGITVAAGTTYEFELYTTIQHDFVTTSGVSASVDIFNTTVSGSPVVSDVMFVDFSSNTTGFTTSATMSSVRSTTAVTVSAAISSGSRFTIVKAKGIIRITGTGTTKIYPGIQTTSASGDNGWTIGTGTTFKMTPIGNGTVTTVGTWA